MSDDDDERRVIDPVCTDDEPDGKGVPREKRSTDPRLARPLRERLRRLNDAHGGAFEVIEEAACHRRASLAEVELGLVHDLGCRPVERVDAVQPRRHLPKAVA